MSKGKKTTSKQTNKKPAWRTLQAFLHILLAPDGSAFLWGWGCRSVVGHLPHVHEGLSSSLRKLSQRH